MKEFVWTDELVYKFAKLYSTASAYGGDCVLSKFKKDNAPKPIFTTTDGVDIWDEDTIVYISSVTGESIGHKASFCVKFIEYEIPVFYREASAARHFESHNKVFSINRVGDVLLNNGVDSNVVIYIQECLIKSLKQESK